MNVKNLAGIRLAAAQQICFSGHQNQSNSIAAIPYCLILLSLLSISAPNQAFGQTWNGGNGIWDTSTPSWGGLWINGSDNIAVFGGTPGTVTLGENILAGGLTFNEGGYTIGAPGGTNTLTLGSAPMIDTVTGITTINAPLAGAAGFTKAGSGTLVLGASNSTLSGNIVINGGELRSELGTSATGTYSNFGTGSITANNGTTLRLRAGSTSNTYTFGNNVNLNSATLVYEDGNHILSGNMALTGSNTINGVWSGKTLRINGIVSGAGSITHTGNSTLTLAGANTYSGGTTLNGGTLAVANSSGLGTGAVSVIANSTLTTSTGFANNISIDNARTLSISGGFVNVSGIISGAGNINANGSIHLRGENTYTGLTTASGGFLSIDRDRNLGAVPTSFTANSLTLTGGGFLSNYIATAPVVLNANRGITLASGNSGGFDVANQSLTVEGVITGAGQLTKQGSNALILRGINTYSGGTVINAGTVSLGTGGTGSNTSNVNALGTGSVTINSGGTLRLWIQNSTSFTIANNLTINGGTLRGEDGIYNMTGTVSVGASGANLTTQWANKNLTLSGVVSGSGPITTRSVNESGSQVILTGANTFTGPVTVASGTLSVGSLNSVVGGVASSNLGAPISVANGTIGIGSASTAGALIYTGTGEVTDRVINLAGTNGGATITQSGTGALRFSSNLAASGVGSKTLTLSGSTAGTGEMAGALVNNGTIGSTSLATTFAIGATTLTLASVDGITVGASISGTGIAPGSTISAINIGTRQVTLSAAATAASSAVGSSYSVAGVNNVSSLTKTGTGTWTLSGANTYTGTTTVNSGTLLFAKRSSLYNNATASWTAGNLIVNSGGTLAFNVGGTGEFTTTDVTTLLTNINGAINNNGLRAGSAIGFDTTNAVGGTFTLSNVIANTTGTGGGAVGLRKFGTGTLSITALNTYTGGTTVNGGILDLAIGGGTGAIRDSLTVNSGATVRVSAVNGLGNAQGSRVGTTTLNGGTLDIQNTGNNSITSATINMNGGTISGVSGGKLDLRNNGAGNTNVTTNASATTSVISVGTLGLPTNDANFTVASGTTTSGIDLTISSNIVNNAGTGGAGAGTSSLTKAGLGTLQLSGTNTYTGDTNANAGALILASTGALQSTSLNMNGGNVVFDSSVVGNAFTFGGLKGTGNLTLANNALIPAAVTLSVGGNNLDTSYSGNLTGGGSLTKVGTGVLVLSGSNTFDGALGINSGTVRAGSASAIGNNSTLNAGGGAGTSVFASADGTSLAFDKSVSTNAASGGITFGDSTGTGNLAFTGNLTRASGATSRTVNVAGNTNVTFNGNLLSPGANASTPFIKGGTGTLTILGTGTAGDVGFSNVIVTGGALTVTRLANLGVASSLGTATNAVAGAVSITLDGGSLNYIDGGAAASSTNRLLQIGRTTAGAIGTIRNNATSVTETITFTNTNAIAYGTSDQTRSLILGGTNTGANTLASIVGDNGSGVVSLTKQDTGRWVLSGANTYTGTTTVSAGTLTVNGSITGGGAISLATGATLDGTGLISSALLVDGTLSGTGTFGSTIVNSGGMLIPGASPGNLTFTSLSLQSNSIFNWELIANSTASPGINFDTVTLTDSLNIATGVKSNLMFSGVDWADSFWTSNRTWNVFTGATSLNFGSFEVSSISGGTGPAPEIGSFSWVTSGNNINLEFTAVPEPTSLLFATIAIAGGAIMRMRQSRRSDVGRTV